MSGETDRLTHLSAVGEANMVDVGGKIETARTAIAGATVKMKPATLKTILDGDAKKGDVIGTARIAGIMAAKRTHELIPLCHPLLLSKIAVEIEPDEALPGLRIRATVESDRQDRRRDGGADRRLGRRADDLRHGQGRRQGHAHR